MARDEGDERKEEEGGLGAQQVGTVGAITLEPGLINVIPARASVTVDLRNTDDAGLEQAERLLDGLAEEEQENLRRQALRNAKARSVKREKDW